MKFFILDVSSNFNNFLGGGNPIFTDNYIYFGTSVSFEFTYN